MKRNVGNFDRIIRVLVAVALGYLHLSGTVTGTFGPLLLVVGIILLLTALAGSCPLYSLLGISSCALKHKA